MVADPTSADSDLGTRISESEFASRTSPEDVGLADVPTGHLGAGMAELSRMARSSPSFIATVVV